jgi:hypothetical protein
MVLRDVGKGGRPGKRQGIVAKSLADLPLQKVVGA